METSLRVEGADKAIFAAHLASVNDHFTKHMDELDYRNFEFYLSRANLSFAMGGAHLGITDDLFMASRCLHDKASLHLERHTIARFLTRRVAPLEVGFVSGQPSTIMEMGTQFGFPLTLLLANDADYKVHREANLLTSFFSRGKCTSHRDLAGLGALAYAGALAAIARGFDDEATLALDIFNTARQPFLDSPPPDAIRPMLLRYDGLCLALLCLIQQQYDSLAQLLTEQVAIYTADLERKHGDQYTAPENPESVRYMDTAAVSILAMAALRKIAIELPDEGPIAHYRGFVEVFTTAPQREEEAPPELDAESRRLLKQMGLNPDEVEANLKQQAEDEALGGDLNSAMASAAGLPPHIAEQLAQFVQATNAAERAKAEAEGAEGEEDADAAEGAEGEEGADAAEGAGGVVIDVAVDGDGGVVIDIPADEEDGAPGAAPEAEATSNEAPENP